MVDVVRCYVMAWLQLMAQAEQCRQGSFEYRTEAPGIRMGLRKARVAMRGSMDGRGRLQSLPGELLRMMRCCPHRNCGCHKLHVTQRR